MKMYKKNSIALAVTIAMVVTGCATYHSNDLNFDELAKKLNAQIEAKQKEIALLKSQIEHVDDEYQQLRSLKERADQLNATVTPGQVKKPNPRMTFTYHDPNRQEVDEPASVRVVPVSPQTAQYQRVRARLEDMQNNAPGISGDNVNELPMVNPYAEPDPYNGPAPEAVPNYRNGSATQARNVQGVQNQNYFIKTSAHSVTQPTKKALPDLAVADLNSGIVPVKQIEADLATVTASKNPKDFSLASVRSESNAGHGKQAGDQPMTQTNATSLAMAKSTIPTPENSAVEKPKGQGSVQAAVYSEKAKQKILNQPYLSASDFIYKYKQSDEFLAQTTWAQQQAVYRPKKQAGFIKASYAKSRPTAVQPDISANFAEKRALSETPRLTGKQSADLRNRSKSKTVSNGRTSKVYYDVAFVMNDPLEAKAMDEYLTLRKVNDKHVIERDGKHFVYLGVFRYSSNAKTRVAKIAAIVGKKPTVSKRVVN